MIQRVQTIYLLLTSIFFFNYWFFGLEWYEKGYPYVINVFNELEYLNTILISISFVPLIISTVSLIAVFLFRNRKLQIKLTRFGFNLCVFMSLFTVFYFYICLADLLNLIPTKTLELLMYAAIANPFICSYFLFKALNSIKKDDELVNSFDRVR